MVSFKAAVSLIALAASAASLPSPFKYGCGQADVIVTGLPPYHPLVTSQGFNPAAVDHALRADAADIVKAGYNLRVVLMGPEIPLSTLANQMNGFIWEGTGVGYGVRGSRLVNLTERFTDIVQLFRDRAPLAPIVFDYSPNSTRWALQKYLPLSSNCTNSPGKDLGIKVFCDICTGDPNANSTKPN